jgi:hypothetical protein
MPPSHRQPEGDGGRDGRDGDVFMTGRRGDGDVFMTLAFLLTFFIELIVNLLY